MDIPWTYSLQAHLKRRCSEVFSNFSQMVFGISPSVLPDPVPYNTEWLLVSGQLGLR